MVQPSDVTVVLAEPEQEPVLANLLQLYCHDFSEFIDLPLGEDGRFGYSRLPLYWRDPNRFPFLVRVADGLAGFAFVTRQPSARDGTEVWDMTEFFIARGFRGRGIGSAAAIELWRRFAGPWEVRVRDSNGPALAFWRRAIGRFVGAPAVPELLVGAEERSWLFSFAASPGTAAGGLASGASDRGAR